MTICIHCRHHNGASPEDPWYNHFCQHPELKRPKEQDPVTGRWGYAIRNDVGNIVMVEEPYPYCRSVNKGNCPYYESK